MKHRIRRSAAAVATTIVLCGLTGCGISAERTPQPIQPPEGISLTTPSPPPDPAVTGRTPEILYFVQDGVVVRVTRHITGTPPPEMIVRDLLAGPNDKESAAGYTSALLGDSVVNGINIAGGHAVVALASPVARNDEVLAYAQIVCTLTAVPEISGVTFTNGGAPVAVPRGDGSLSEMPLTADDYTDLIGK